MKYSISAALVTIVTLAQAGSRPVYVPKDTSINPLSKNFPHLVGCFERYLGSREQPPCHPKDWQCGCEHVKYEPIWVHFNCAAKMGNREYVADMPSFRLMRLEWCVMNPYNTTDRIMELLKVMYPPSGEITLLPGMDKEDIWKVNQEHIDEWMERADYDTSRTIKGWGLPQVHRPLTNPKYFNLSSTSTTKTSSPSTATTFLKSVTSIKGTTNTTMTTSSSTKKACRSTTTTSSSSSTCHRNKASSTPTQTLTKRYL